MQLDGQMRPTGSTANVARSPRYGPLAADFLRSAVTTAEARGVRSPTPRGLLAARGPTGRRPNPHRPTPLSFCGGPPGSPLSAPAAGHQA